MLIIFPKPVEGSEYHTLAVNLETIDEVIMFKHVDADIFSLSILKLFDAHDSNQSRWHYTLGTFESADDCLGLFVKILDALNSGKKNIRAPAHAAPSAARTCGSPRSAFRNCLVSSI